MRFQLWPNTATATHLNLSGEYPLWVKSGQAFRAGAGPMSALVQERPNCCMSASCNTRTDAMQLIVIVYWTPSSAREASIKRAA